MFVGFLEQAVSRTQVLTFKAVTSRSEDETYMRMKRKDSYNVEL